MRTEQEEPSLTPGLHSAGTGMLGIAWNILGQTYVPLQCSARSMAWHATFPAGSFVPPHVHPTQDELVYVLTGALEMGAEAGTRVAGLAACRT